MIRGGGLVVVQLIVCEVYDFEAQLERIVLQV